MRTPKILFFSLAMALLSIVWLSSCELSSGDNAPDQPQQPVEINFDRQSETLQAGDSVQLLYQVNPNTTVLTDLVWTSSNTDIATITNTGIVKAVSIGYALITLRSEKAKAEATLSITVAPTPLNNIFLEDTVVSAYINEPKTLGLTYAPVDATDKRVRWRSSDNAVAEVDQNGTITAKKLGYAWVGADQDDRVYDHLTIIPARRGQVLAASQINLFNHEQRYFYHVHIGALESPTIINEVRLYYGAQGETTAGRILSVSPALALDPGKADIVKIETTNTPVYIFGHIRMDATVANVGYYITLDRSNNINITLK